MKQVVRERIPPSLKQNGDEWAKELLCEIEKSKKTNSKVPKRFYDKYKQSDVLSALRVMYGYSDTTLCCYCESQINDVSYERIEHRMPRRKSLDKYPEKTYDWNNLHLACEKCNGKKGNQYDEDAPILDATLDPIEEHLGYKIGGLEGVYREMLSDRGETTVKHADLDRRPLRIARLKIWIEITEAIKEINRLRNDPKASTEKRVLRDKCLGEHGSLIKYLLNEWGILNN